MRYPKLLPVLFFFFITINCFAQNTGSVSGSVIDAETQEPISFANIAVMQSDSGNVITGSMSDENGYFELINIPPGGYTMAISFLGYDHYTQTGIVIQPNKNTDLGTINLKPTSTKIEEVAVLGQRPSIVQGLGKTTLNINDNVGEEGESALELLKYLPSTNADLESNVTVRGAPVTVLIDGVETDLANALETLPIGIIDQIEVITNPSAKYPSQSGGSIINIVLKKDKVSGANGKIYLGGGNPEKYHGGGNLMLRKKKWGSTTNLNISHNTNESVSDRWRQNLQDDANYMQAKATGSSEANQTIIRQSLKYRISDSSFVRLNGTYRYTKYEYNNSNDTHWFDSSSSPLSHNKTLTDGFSKRHYWNAMLLYQNDFSEYNNLRVIAKHEGQDNHSPMHRTIHDYNVTNGLLYDDYQEQSRSLPERVNSNRLQLDHERRIGERSKYEGGFLIFHRHTSIDNDFLKYVNYYHEDTQSYETVVDSSNVYDFEVKEFIPAIYSIYTLELDKFSVSAGLRFEYIYLSPQSTTIDSTIVSTHHNLLPSLQLQYKLNEQTSFNLSVSQRTKMPNVKQLNPIVVYNGLYNKSSGNPYLKPEKITNLELSAQSDINHYTLNTSMFFKNYSDIISVKYSTVTEDGNDIIYRQYDNFGLMRQIGGEFNVNNNMSEKINIKLNLMAMNQHIENQNNGENIEVDDFIYSGKLTFEQTFLESFRWMFNASYHSPSESIGHEKQEIFYINLGLRKSFINKRLMISAQAYDIFDTRRYRNKSYSSGFESTNNTKNITRRFVLSASFKFNSIKEL